MTAVAAIDADMRRMTRASAACRRLMTIPGIGQLTALAFVAAIDDPSRIRRSRDVGAYLGLVPKRYQSGEVDYVGGQFGETCPRLFRTAHLGQVTLKSFRDLPLVLNFALVGTTEPQKVEGDERGLRPAALGQERVEVDAQRQRFGAAAAAAMRCDGATGGAGKQKRKGKAYAGITHSLAGGQSPVLELESGASGSTGRQDRTQPC